MTKEELNKQFKLNQEKDQLKRDFCERKSINLLEISYKDFDNIENILERELFNYGKL